MFTIAWRRKRDGGLEVPSNFCKLIRNSGCWKVWLERWICAPLQGVGAKFSPNDSCKNIIIQFIMCNFIILIIIKKHFVEKTTVTKPAMRRLLLSTCRQWLLCPESHKFRETSPKWPLSNRYLVISKDSKLTLLFVMERRTVIRTKIII